MIMNEQTSTILVVDDQPNNLKVLLAFLRQHDFEVRVAQNGERALKVLQQNLPDIILLDVMMPGMNGFETCRLIKADAKIADIPVIFMTALDSVEDKVTGFEAGGVDYITKPFQQLEVLARLNTHITLRRQKLALERMAIHDQLTGLFNRHHFIKTMEKEMSRCNRYNTELSLMMLDLDHFKHVNDTCGHKFGDFVLQEFARRLQQSVRRADSVFRYGGEEFVVLLPQCDSKGCRVTAEKLRKQCEQQPFQDNSAKKTVMVSIGIASCNDLSRHPDRDLLSCADHALYQAKGNGRNQVNVYRQS